MANDLLPLTDDDLLFEQSYMVDVLPKQGSMDLAADIESATNLPAALASAAYGYTRGGQFSPFNAAIFGFFGYSYPLISTLLFAADAVFIQDTPAKRAAGTLFSKHGPAIKARMGLSGLGVHDFVPTKLVRRCSRYSGGRCVKWKKVRVRR